MSLVEREPGRAVPKPPLPFRHECSSCGAAPDSANPALAEGERLVPTLVVAGGLTVLGDLLLWNHSPGLARAIHEQPLAEPGSTGRGGSSLARIVRIGLPAVLLLAVLIGVFASGQTRGRCCSSKPRRSPEAWSAPICESACARWREFSADDSGRRIGANASSEPTATSAPFSTGPRGRATSPPSRGSSRSSRTTTGRGPRWDTVNESGGALRPSRFDTGA